MSWTRRRLRSWCLFGRYSLGQRAEPLAFDSGEYLRALWTEGVNRSRAVVQAQLSRGEEAALSETGPSSLHHFYE
jgi:hypothetical protein